MGCCCDEDDGDILTHLVNSNFSSPSSPETLSSFSSSSSSCTVVISPMNSHFPALSSTDILRIIFQKLPIPDLARASCVCRLWNSVASQRDMVTTAFLAPWKLKDVVGNPLSRSFWRDNSLAKFAISHRVMRGDSVASLAVKYSIQVMDIKRLNNMMSDHGIYSRERLLIPISNSDILVDRTCFIELDVYAKREVAVLYPNDVPDRRTTYVSNRISSEESNKKVRDSLKRSMQVDNETAQYYWSVGNGDPRAAFAEFSADLQWDRQAGHS
ncbi:F-box protein At1g55000 isoform X2 [Abrus precatorius]|uniref:F-box protein At1g55000 isoform X1 n=1 Tax=Abrus precatorius TaxID=3816 RepID=A0A8B8MD46_ABRPR|nr:F-box protein At1g55000 isoform X1 [Abrus precatorius]XP_027366612.1 F-box protein At1g55000 isoform X2 [Abrus precatorius]